MASEKMITVTVDKTGQAKIEAHGFADNTCLAATKSIEEALGKVDKRDLKPEGLKEPENTVGLTIGS